MLSADLLRELEECGGRKEGGEGGSEGEGVRRRPGAPADKEEEEEGSGVATSYTPEQREAVER